MPRERQGVCYRIKSAPWIQNGGLHCALLEFLLDSAQFFNDCAEVRNTPPQSNGAPVTLLKKTFAHVLEH